MNTTRTYGVKATLYIFLAAIATSAYAQEFKPVQWRAGGGSVVKQIRYFESDKPNELLPAAFSAEALPAGVAVNVIDSPPVDGFVPWIVVLTTDKAIEDDYVAVTETSIRGALTTPDSQNDYAIGIFDTGASAHVFGHENALLRNLYPTYLTANTTSISGVTGSVDAWVSLPIGIFIKGLSALTPGASGSDAKLLSTAGLVGQSNVSIIVGDEPLAPQQPDLATAIGSPMSVYFTTVIRNDNPVTITRAGQQFTAPDIKILPHDDPNIPDYPNKVPLELRPLGAVNVQYIPTLDPFNFTLEPSSPSIITGNGSQSLFFVSSVDLYDGAHSAIDKSRFMFDTGAQITTIGSRIAARLGLDPQNPAFEVEIVGVTGDSIMAPGFFLDRLEIPALGQWLEYTNVPVILLDIFSPEGGTLDGIIGMNLFTQYNLVLHGGGLFLEDDPYFAFEKIAAPIKGDIAPAGGDGVVDMQDLAAYSRLWTTTTQSPGWNPKADIAPTTPDGIINTSDLMLLAQNWLTSQGQ